MKAGGGGRIINMSDWLVISGRPRYPGYTPVFRLEGGGRGDHGKPRARPRAGYPGEFDRAGADFGAARLIGRRARGSDGGNASGPMGWRRGDRESRAFPDRNGLCDRRVDPRRWRPPSLMTAASGRHLAWRSRCVAIPRYDRQRSSPHIRSTRPPRHGPRNRSAVTTSHAARSHVRTSRLTESWRSARVRDHMKLNRRRRAVTTSRTAATAGARIL